MNEAHKAMDGLCITDAAKIFGVTSKTLRYYERVGLLVAERADGNNYRYYSEADVERIKQILILRKMQISIKDIVRIYESEDMSTVVEVFVNRVSAIDEEVGTLNELRRITNDFLQTMLNNGVTKISTLPILYEQMEKQLDTLEKSKATNDTGFMASSMEIAASRIDHAANRIELSASNTRLASSYSELSAISDRLAKPVEPSILFLPPMRVVSSVRAADGASDPDGFLRWAQAKGLPQGEPGQHESFEFQAGTGDDDVLVLKVADDWVNDGDYTDYILEGGLFTAANVYLDEDVNEQFRALIKSFDENKYYQIDYMNDGSLRHAAMLENLISPDSQRELAALLAPVKKRMADPALFDAPEELTGISAMEIEAANPTIWETCVPLDKMTQTHAGNSSFRINENGEAEYIGWILRAALNTNVSVKLPFRVDMEFRLSGIGKTGVVVYHSEDTGYPLGRIGNRGFGVNMGNDNEKMIEAIRFAQPIFWDDYNFPGRGAISKDGPNLLTWVVGAGHLAVVINGEVRYCGANFPYMSMDLSREEACPIVVGTSYGNDKVIFRSIRVSQLADTQKNKLKKGELTLITKQSNNIIPVIHRLVTDEYGENYWFNGCAKYVMECLGENDYDYWFFAGLTGDLFTQHYAYEKSFWDAIDGYMFEENPKQFVKDIFAKCGYAATYVSKQEIQDNTEMYLQTLIAYIDKGVPVINWEGPCGVFVGYEEYGKILLVITGNKNQPERITLEQVLQNKDFVGSGWIFVGEKKESLPLAQLYRDAIAAIPRHFNIKADAYCFGAEAFRAWANDVENGKFDGMRPEEFETWAYYTNYVCVLATNGSCCHGFLQKARELNPDMGFLEDVGNLYYKMKHMGNGDPDSLEALGGGFNVTLEVLQDKEKRAMIAAKIKKFADVADEIARIVQDNM